MEEQKKSNENYYYGDYVSIDDDMKCDFLRRGNIFFIADSSGKNHLYMIASSRFINVLNRVMCFTVMSRPFTKDIIPIIVNRKKHYINPHIMYPIYTSDFNSFKFNASCTNNEVINLAIDMYCIGLGNKTENEVVDIMNRYHLYCAKFRATCGDFDSVHPEDVIKYGKELVMEDIAIQETNDVDLIEVEAESVENDSLDISDSELLKNTESLNIPDVSVDNKPVPIQDAKPNELLDSKILNIPKLEVGQKYIKIKKNDGSYFYAVVKNNSNKKVPKQISEKKYRIMIKRGQIKTVSETGIMKDEEQNQNVTTKPIIISYSADTNSMSMNNTDNKTSKPIIHVDMEDTKIKTLALRIRNGEINLYHKPYKSMTRDEIAGFLYLYKEDGTDALMKIIGVQKIAIKKKYNQIMNDYIVNYVNSKVKVDSMF